MSHAGLIEARDLGNRRISLRLLQLTALGAIVTASYMLGVRRSESRPPAAGLQAAATVAQPRAVPADRAAERAAPHALDVAGQGPSALAQRDNVVAALRASGPDQRGLGRAAGTVLSSWIAKVTEFGVAADWGNMECYAKGCFVTIAHPSEHAASRATDVITRTSEFNGWQTGKMRSGVIPRPDGTVEVTWVLNAPPPNQEALAAPLPPDSLEELRHAWAHTTN